MIEHTKGIEGAWDNDMEWGRVEVWVFGVQHGTTYAVDRGGRIIAEEVWENGRQVGESKHYRPGQGRKASSLFPRIPSGDEIPRYFGQYDERRWLD